MALTVIAQGNGWQVFKNYKTYMTQAGNNLPEGTPVEIDFEFGGSFGLSYGADYLNRQLAANGVTPWSGTSTYATVSGSTIILRWVKESIFLDLIFLAMTAILSIVGYNYLHNWTFGAVKSVQSGGSVFGGNTGTSTGSKGILGTANLWAWALVAVAGLAVVRQMIVAKEDARRFGL